MARTTLFCWRDIARTPGVIFTPSSEVAGHPATNAQKPHPADFWRIPTPERASLSVTFPQPTDVRAVALVNTTATGHKQLLRQTVDLRVSPWNQHHLTVVQGPDSIVTAGGQDAVRWYLTEDTANDTHHFEQANLSKPTTGGAGAFKAMYVGQDIYVQRTPLVAARNLALQIYGTTGSDWAYAGYDLGAGTVQSVGPGGNFTDADASIELHQTPVGSNDIWRCRLAGKTDADSHNMILLRFYMLDDAFNLTYTGSGLTHLHVWAPKAEYLKAASGFNVDASLIRDDWPETADGSTAPVWSAPVNFAPQSDLDIGNQSTPEDRHVPTRSNEIAFRTQRGWLSSYLHTTTPNVLDTGALVIDIHDPNNVDGQLDISQVGIYGPSGIYQPSYDIQPGWEWLTREPVSGARRLRVPVAGESESKLYRELSPMLDYCGVGKPPGTIVTNGGQEYRPGMVPVFVVLKTDETEHAQEETFYGWLDSVDATRAQGSPTFEATLTLTEVLP